MGTSSEILIFRSAVMWLSIFKTIRLLYLMRLISSSKCDTAPQDLLLFITKRSGVAECTRIFEGQGDGMSSCLPEYERDPSSLGVNQQRWSADKLFRLIGSKLDSASFLSVYRHRGCERWDGSTTKREYTFCCQYRSGHTNPWFYAIKDGGWVGNDVLAVFPSSIHHHNNMNKRFRVEAKIIPSI
ncbi:hypothetical protein D5086_019952 [Populus alba]|uniref:Uncharacterized protein n=1 Tax=Populus alba TaxID=43335 RepID=A0ACC4BK96_POPAL